MSLLSWRRCPKMTGDGGSIFAGKKVRRTIELRDPMSQDKYVAEILRKFSLTDEKSASTPIDTEKPLLKDPDGEDVDVHTYRSMIGSLMYLTSSRPDIMFAKKVIITEATIQEALRLDDAESIDCSPNDEIFTELSRMGYEKPSTKLTFYKAFFLQQWKFLIHTILQCMSAKRTSWNKFSSSMALDVFCLSTVVVGVDVDVVPAAAAAKPSIPSPTPTTQPPPPSQELPSTSQVISTPPPSPIVEPSPTPQQQQPSQPTHDAEILLDLLHTLLETCTTLTRVKKLERKNKLKVSGLRRLRKVGTTQRIESSVDIVMDDQEDASKHGEIIANIDADEDVTLKDVVAIEKSAEIKENADVQRRLEESQANIYKIDLEHADKKQAQIEQDEAYAREIEAELNKNINWDDVIKQVQRKEKEDNAVMSSSMEESNECLWISKCQKLETVRVMWSAHHNIYNYINDLAGREKISTNKIYKETTSSRIQTRVVFGYILHQNQDQDKVLLLLLPVQVVSEVSPERRYPLTRFTLDQMMNNVRSEVEEESKVSLELLRFVRQQQQERFRLE
nr:hypothetical protein [Tanacetum cinerariifolium]